MRLLQTSKRLTKPSCLNASEDTVEKPIMWIQRNFTV